ncbi:hypothetical protein [Actinokineospora sp. NBRC 105648]|uniref:hypothetical protein n=1 Tax=Actinokineospora sp. NBRC 105648 TaxID=3032206 RepID=UPI0024A3A1E8|nr:hypothetical protein [Actinokineospora sp. NBRC 105648]GLZ36889.1 hypothetical protein Acsp05_05140 [Actinokineospora sp. NBRC 105648]
MTARWAFLAALATTGALLFRHPTSLWAAHSGWDAVWVAPVVSAAALVVLWRFPGRAWPWVLAVGGALSLAVSILWIDGWPLAGADGATGPPPGLLVVSLLGDTAAALLLLGALGAAARLLAAGARPTGAALAGVAAGAYLVGAQLRLDGIEPSMWDTVRFTAAGIAVVGAVSAVLVTWRDNDLVRARPVVLGMGLAAVLVGAALDVHGVLTLGQRAARDAESIQALETQSGVIAAVSAVVLLALAAGIAWWSALEVVGLAAVVVAGLALVEVGLSRFQVAARPAPSSVAPAGATVWLALGVGLLGFAALGLLRRRAWAFAALGAVAAVLLPLAVDGAALRASQEDLRVLPDGRLSAPLSVDPWVTAGSVALLVAGAGLIALAAAVVGGKLAATPAALVVVIGLAAIPAGSLAARGVQTLDYDAFSPLRQYEPSWWVALLLGGAAVLVAAGTLVRPRDPSPALQ